MNVKYKVIFLLIFIFTTSCKVDHNINITPKEIKTEIMSAKIFVDSVKKKDNKYLVHFKLNFTNHSEKEVSIHLSKIKLKMSDGSYAQIYRDVPATVINDSIKVEKAESIMLKLYTFTKSRNELFIFSGIHGISEKVEPIDE